MLLLLLLFINEFIKKGEVHVGNGIAVKVATVATVACVGVLACVWNGHGESVLLSMLLAAFAL